MVDWGDDAIVSQMYKENHALSEKLTRSRIRDLLLSRVETARSQKALLSMSLAEQRNEGIHPSSVAALGVKWATLLKKYGFSSLIDHGFSWDNMREMGITAKQACCMLPSQLAALGVNASRLVELQPSISDIASMKMQPVELKHAGYTPELLQSLGLNAKTMINFGYSLGDWANVVGIRNWKELGFTDYSECERLGWSTHDMYDLQIIDTQQNSERVVETHSDPAIECSLTSKGGLTF